MESETVRLLLIEDNPVDVRLIERMLSDARELALEIESVDRLSAGLECCARGGIGLILLDLSLPDSQGLDTLRRVRAESPETPVVVLTGLDDTAIAVEALQEGAQDYLIKGQFDNGALLRSVRYALERHGADKALRESQERYRSMIEDILDISRMGLFVLDSEFRVVWINRTLESYFGLDRQDVIGKDKRDLIRTCIKDIFHDPEAFARTLLTSYETNTFVETFLCQVRAGPRRAERWLEHWSQPVRSGLYAGGRIEHYYDITARKRAEKAVRDTERKYRQFLENLQEGVWAVDRNGYTTFANTHLASMLGYSVEEMLGKHMFTFMDEHGREIYQKEMERREKGRKTRREFEFLRKNGTKTYAFLEESPLTDDDGNYEGTIAGILDVTEYRALEAQLRQAQKMEAVGRLAGGLAHDFNNILTGITGYTMLLLSEAKEGSGWHRDLCQIQELADRAAILTRQLLAFSRHQPMEAMVLNLNELIRKITRMLHRLIGEDIKLEFRSSVGLENVRADPSQIEQVLMNLAVNARDAMPKGGRLVIQTANVTLDEEYADRHHEIMPGSYVMLSVSDSGCGMDEATRERIFEPFFTTKETGKGTGLGLSTVYGIVKQHGGSIWVYSELGRGSTFKIYFPRVPDPVQTPVTTRQPVAPQGSETILVVEDQAEVRSLVQRVLQKQGYTVLAATAPAEAEDLFLQLGRQIALLVTDVVMPGLSGPDLYERLKKNYPSLAVLYMSGYSDSVVIRSGLPKRGTGFIQKPFSPDALGRKVRQVLDK